MRTVKGAALTMLGIVTAIVAVGRGDSINGASNGWTMIGWAFVSFVLLAAALVLVGLGSCADREACKSEAKKLKRIHTNSNEWRDAR
jgi:hypothetical protein|nr:MAG TPA: hypothetical protein [Caudoviricetes sp.]